MLNKLIEYQLIENWDTFWEKSLDDVKFTFSILFSDIHIWDNINSRSENRILGYLIEDPKRNNEMLSQKHLTKKKKPSIFE